MRDEIQDALRAYFRLYALCTKKAVKHVVSTCFTAFYFMAEGMGFEPMDPVKSRRFSRPLP